MKLSEFITALMAQGICVFSSDEVKKALGSSEITIRAALRRLKQKGEIAQPINGFYVIVPPEYRILGCRPAEHFISQLMEYIGAPYYVALLSAAQYHGAAHHRPQQFQIITSLKRRPILCGNIKIVFITKIDAAETPTQTISTSHGFLTVSTPEATARDIVIYANRCGGIDNTLSVLRDLAEKIDAKKLLKLVSQSKEFGWVQRLGYLLELADAKDISNQLIIKMQKCHLHFRPLNIIKKDNIKNYMWFSSVLPLNEKVNLSENLKINKKWKLIINKKLEKDS